MTEPKERLGGCGGFPSSAGSGGGSSAGGGGGGGGSDGSGGGGEGGGGGFRDCEGGSGPARGTGLKELGLCPFNLRSIVSLSLSAPPMTFACKKERGADGGTLFMVAAYRRQSPVRRGHFDNVPNAKQGTPWPPVSLENDLPARQILLSLCSTKDSSLSSVGKRSSPHCNEACLALSDQG